MGLDQYTRIPVQQLTHPDTFIPQLPSNRVVKRSFGCGRRSLRTTGVDRTRPWSQPAMVPASHGPRQPWHDAQEHAVDAMHSQTQPTHSLPPIPGRSSRAVSLLLILSVWFTFDGLASAQLPQIRLTSVFPAGGQIGTSCEVVVEGTDLDEASELWLSDPHVSAVLKRTEQDGVTTIVANTFVVTIAPQAQPCVCDVRVGGRYGLSNPRSFELSGRQEICEAEPNDSLENATPVIVDCVINARSDQQADVDMYRFDGQQGQRVLVACRAASLDSRCLAVMELYDARGHRLAHSEAGAAGEPLLDVVLPDDGPYCLKVFDAVFRGGNEYLYRLHLHSGPHIDFVLPASGRAGSEAAFTLWGRNLPGGSSVGDSSADAPWQGLTVSLTVPTDSSHLQLSDHAASFQAGSDRWEYTLTADSTRSNFVPIFFSSDPVLLEAEPNDTPAAGQELDVPIEVTGQFQARGDVDHYEFSATAGQVLWIEATGHRDGSGADPYVILEQIHVDGQGNETGTSQIAAQDDAGNELFPEHFSTLTYDVAFPFTAPADARYRLSVRDRYFESRGDPRLVYRLSIRSPRPDFRLLVVPVAPLNGQNNNTAAPWPINLRKGDRFLARLLAFRRDGFNGPIVVEVEGLKDGVACPPVTLAPGQTSTWLAFTASDSADAGWSDFTVIGKAEGSPATASHQAGGSELVRTARAGTIVWPATPERPAVSRLARTNTISVLDELAPLQLEMAASTLEVNRGRQILIPTQLLKRHGFDGNVSLTWEGLPPNVQADTTPIHAGAAEALQRMYVLPTAPPGTYTLVLKGQTQVAYTRASNASGQPAGTENAPQPQNLDVVVCSVPLVLNIKEHPATLSVGLPADAQLKRGSEIALPVTVNRANGFAGPVTISLALPAGVTGLSADPVTIEAQQQEGILKVLAAADATEGPLANLVVQGAMEFHGNAVIDQPISLKVVP